MKKLTLLTASVLFTLSLLAQKVDPFPKTISVSGSAEMEIVPDEVFVNIDIREYQKKGDDKKDLETLKKQFTEAYKAVGIPDSAVSIIAYTGYNDYYTYSRNKKKSPDMMAGLTYQVKFKSSKTMDELVAKLDDEATRGFTIAYANHTKMIEFRKQLKIEAIKAAKAKGIYLTEAIDEKLGEAIDIEEPKESSTSWSAGSNYRSNGVVSNVMPTMSQAVVPNASFGDSESSSEVGFRKIKLRFEVEVIFALK